MKIEASQIVADLRRHQAAQQAQGLDVEAPAFTAGWFLAADATNIDAAIAGWQGRNGSGYLQGASWQDFGAGERVHTLWQRHAADVEAGIAAGRQFVEPPPLFNPAYALPVLATRRGRHTDTNIR